MWCISSARKKLKIGGREGRKALGTDHGCYEREPVFVHKNQEGCEFCGLWG